MTCYPIMAIFPALPEFGRVSSAAAAAWLRRYRRFWRESLDRLAVWLDEDRKKGDGDERRKD